MSPTGWQLGPSKSFSPTAMPRLARLSRVKAHDDVFVPALFLRKLSGVTQKLRR